MNQADLIEKAIGELHTRETAFETACKDFAEADHAYRIAKATAFLNADGAVEARKMIADVKCSAEMQKKKTAEAVRDFTKAKLDDVRAVLSARQSILSAESKVHFATQNLRP